MVSAPALSVTPSRKTPLSRSQITRLAYVCILSGIGGPCGVLRTRQMEGSGRFSRKKGYYRPQKSIIKIIGSLLKAYVESVEGMIFVAVQINSSIVEVSVTVTPCETRVNASFPHAVQIATVCTREIATEA